MRATVFLLCAGLVAAGCGDDDVETTTAAAGPSTGGGRGTATVAVRLEDTNGAFFTEGFDLQLRFQAGDGEIIAERNWTEFVQQQGADRVEAFYDSVLEEEVPAGELVLVTDLYISPGGPIPPPPRWGTDASNPCRTVFEAAPGERVEITVLFSPVDGRCVEIGGGAPPAAAAPEVFDGSLAPLTERSGCGYAFFYAIDPAGTVLLSARASDLFVAHRDAAGTVVTRTFELPSPELDVSVEVGPAVRGATCTDVAGRKDVARTYRAVGGTAELTMRIVDPAFQSRGDLVLRGVVLEPEGAGERVTMDDITFTDAQIGTEQG